MKYANEFKRTQTSQLLALDARITALQHEINAIRTEDQQKVGYLFSSVMLD